MEIIKKFVLGKADNSETCEDVIVATDDFIAVIDGATAKDPTKYEGKKSGKIVSEVLAQAMMEMPADVTMEECITRMDNAIAVKYEEYGITEAVKSDVKKQFTAAAAVYSRKHHEIWIVGDGQCRYDGVRYSYESPVDHAAREARSAILNYKIATGEISEDDIAENDVGREFIQPLLQRQYAFINGPKENPYSFTVFNGLGIDTSRVVRHELPENVKEITLASDGYPELLASFKETEEHLAYVVKKDPLCYKINKGTKGIEKGNISFDDRAYIQFRV